MANWKVQVKKGYFNKGDQEYEEVEVSVVHKDNTHGQRSYGWNGDDKIIFDCNEASKKHLKTLIGCACAVADYLNNRC